MFGLHPGPVRMMCCSTQHHSYHQPAVLSVSEGVLKASYPMLRVRVLVWSIMGKIFFEVCEVLTMRYLKPAAPPCVQGSQPVSKREQVRREHAEWSDKTFGDVGPRWPA